MTDTTVNPEVGEVEVPENLVLAGDFETPTHEQWLKEVAKVLNRKVPEDKQISGEQAVAKLTQTTIDGVKIAPMYWYQDRELGAPGVAPFTRGATIRNGEMDAWDVTVLHEDPDVAYTNQAILTDLERGATSVWLRLDSDAIAPADLPKVLAGVHLDMVAVYVSSNYDQAAAAQALLDLAAGAADPSALTLNLGIDPIGAAALSGEKADLSQLAGWVKEAAKYGNSRAIAVDARIYHNAGAGDVHEIAWALATGTEYARTLIEAGLTPEQAFNSILFRVTASVDQFATIARLRALRPLWNKVGEVLEVPESARGARQHAVSSWRELTRDDAAVNMLRGSISTFAASVGMAESITVLPFDSVHGLPDELSRRIARNTQIILAEESNIARVNDPGGGSWYIEQLTSDFAQRAWEEFQKVEAAGGMAAALESGLIAETLAGLNAERAKRLAKRTHPITGVSMFPNPAERPVDARPRPEAPAREGLAWHRDAEVFEALRDRTASAAGKPSVFLACLGLRRDFGGREGFAVPVFNIAGLATPQAEGGTIEEIVAKFKESGTTVACLCSSAKVYADQGLATAKALKQAGATKVLLAGNIKELGEGAAEAADIIDGTIYAGMDVVTLLDDVLETLGVAK